MLEELHVRHVGGIASAVLRFRAGFIAITGESGAGKSSLVRALEFVSGKRAQTSMIQMGKEEAEVQALLAVDRIKGLPEGCSPQEGTLVVRRVLSRSGRGKSYIQGNPVPLHFLARSLEGVVEIQSQFAHLNLLDPGQQMEMLDVFGGQKVLEIRRELGRTIAEALEREREIALIRRRRAELEERYENLEELTRQVGRLGIVPDAEERWGRELTALGEQLKRAMRLQTAVETLWGNASDAGILAKLEELFRELPELTEDAEDSSVVVSYNEALERLQSLGAMLRNALGERLPEELEQEVDILESRIGALRKLKRQFRVATAEELLERCAAAKDDLAWLESSREDLEQLRKKQEQLRRDAGRLAMQLRRLRSVAASDLEKRINAVLNELAMEGMTFSIRLHFLDKVRPEGAEEVAFTLAAGGAEAGPVNKVASGGELSRLLLALQLSLPQERLPSALVFDEVEAGLGGRAALLAGYKLKDLSEKCQVLLITHEATIAALATQHFVVTREGDQTFVNEVEGEPRVREIARMLSGDADSPEACAHARRLLLESNSAMSRMEATMSRPNAQ
jgi:DNA repair protein RecN (Recombination protein N)